MKYNHDKVSKIMGNRPITEDNVEDARLYLHEYLYGLFDHLGVIEDLAVSNVGWFIESLANERVIIALNDIRKGKI